MNTPFKEARLAAGLTINETAELLSIDPVSVRRFEMNPKTTKTSRNAPELAIKVLCWYAEQTPPTFD